MRFSIRSFCHFLLFCITINIVFVALALSLAGCSGKKGGAGGEDISDEATIPADAAPEREPAIFAPGSGQSRIRIEGTEYSSGEPFSLCAVLKRLHPSSFCGRANEIELSYSVLSYGEPSRPIRLRQASGTWEIPAPTAVVIGQELRLALAFETPSREDGRFSAYDFLFRVRIADISETSIRGNLCEQTYVASEDEMSYLLLPVGTDVTIIKR